VINVRSGRVCCTADRWRHESRSSE